MTVPVETRRGLAAGLGSVAVAVLVLLPLRGDLDRTTIALVLVLPGVVAGVVGGRVAAGVTAVVASFALNLGFIEPYGTLSIGIAEQLVDLVVFGAVALTTGTLVAREADRRAAAERRAAEVVAARAEQQRLAAEAMAVGLASEHRAALLRAVSHDLRTPLSTIRAVASDLRDGGGHYDAATADDLLDQCVRRFGRLVRDRRVSVDVPLTLPAVEGDWTLIDQAVTNLVANAVRHAPEGTRIVVSAREADDGWVEVSVSDQGPGIPAELREAILQPFRRGPGSSSSGVGLTIVKGVVDAHGGRLSVESADRGGARIAFTLPVHRG